MFDGEQWTSTRKLMAATPIVGVLAIILFFIFGVATGPLYYIAMAAALVGGSLNLLCIFMFYSDAKKTAERSGQRPRWWAYSLSALFVTSFLVAPIYLGIWRNV